MNKVIQLTPQTTSGRRFGVDEDQRVYEFNYGTSSAVGKWGNPAVFYLDSQESAYVAARPPTGSMAISFIVIRGTRIYSQQIPDTES